MRINTENMKKIIYSANIGGYDKTFEPKVISKGWKYLMFTDNPDLVSENWEIIVVDNPENLDSVRLARSIKTQYYKYIPECEISIWADSNLIVNCDLDKLVETYASSGKNLYTTKHPHRNCSYDEARECIAQNKDNHKLIMNQMTRYEKDGFPRNLGLPQTNCIIRIHKDEGILKKFGDLWFGQIKSHSRRDQLSFMYALWKMKLNKEDINVSFFPSQIMYNTEFILNQHNHGW